MPADVGVKVTLIAQLPGAAILAPQLFVVPKLAEATIPDMINGALPVFARVTVWAALVVPTAWEVVNVTVAGERVAIGAVLPTPFSEMTCGLFPALSTKVTEPDALPAVVGVKVTVIEQIPPAGRDAPQVLVCAKGAVGVMEVRVKGAVPLLVSVTVCAALVELTIWVPKLRVPAESDTAGAPTPVPDSGTT